MDNGNGTETETYLRAALTAGRRFGAREIAFGTDGITITDPVGGKHFIGHSMSGPAPEAIKEMLDGRFRSWDTDGYRITGHGAWTLKDNPLTLRAARPRHAALERIAKPQDPEKLDLLRSLYGLPDVDIFVACEGAARAADVALCLAAELNLSGTAAAVAFPPEHKYDYSRGRNETSADQEGRADGDPVFPGAGTADTGWRVELLGEGAAGPETSPVSRIIVKEDARRAAHYAGVDGAAFPPSARKVAVIGVRLERSHPVLSVALSPEARAVADGGRKWTSAPWKTELERIERRRASRPSAPKTWHPTTAHVAEAFVAREAPRGYVSGASLFFHGPVAFSVWDGNPVAAFVDLPDGTEVLFEGRSHGMGGTIAGTVTSAQGDISRALKDRSVQVFQVGALSDILTLGDEDLANIAGRMRRAKNEGEYPRGCTLHRDRVEAYLTGRRERAQKELERASKTSVATHTKAGCWYELAEIAAMRDALCSLFGFDLPGMGDASEFRGKERTERATATERQRTLAERRQKVTEAMRTGNFL